MHTHEGRPSSEFSAKLVDEDDTGQKEYPLPLEDYSQSAINRGQQYINYELTVVNERIAKALEAFKDAIKGSAVGSQIDLEAVEGAISEVKAANKKVAGWYPPGCSSGGSSSAGNTGGNTGSDTGGGPTS